RPWGMKPRWRVVIVDDHAHSRATVAETVTLEGGQVVGNGSRVEDAVCLVERHRPDVAILAVGLSDGDGVEAARQVMTTYPCPVVLLTSRTEAPVVARAVEAGGVRLPGQPPRAPEPGPPPPPPGRPLPR